MARGKVMYSTRPMETSAKKMRPMATPETAAMFEADVSRMLASTTSPPICMQNGTAIIERAKHASERDRGAHARSARGGRPRWSRSKQQYAQMAASMTSVAQQAMSDAMAIALSFRNRVVGSSTSAQTATRVSVAGGGWPRTRLVRPTAASVVAVANATQATRVCDARMK